MNYDILEHHITMNYSTVHFKHTVHAPVIQFDLTYSHKYFIITSFTSQKQ